MSAALAAGEARPATEWLSIREASALVGVSVATLRRWSDAGRLPVFITPGGHRRFPRDAVLELVAAPQPAVAALAGDDPSPVGAIVRAYRRVLRRSPALPQPLATLDPADRAALRRHGRRIVAALVESLDAPADARAALGARAGCGAATCGRIAAAAGLSLQDTLDLFVRFRAPFLHELGAACGRRGLDAAAATSLLERASDMMDRLLPAVVTGFEHAPGSARAAIPADPAR